MRDKLDKKWEELKRWEALRKCEKKWEELRGGGKGCKDAKSSWVGFRRSEQGVKRCQELTKVEQVKGWDTASRLEKRWEKLKRFETDWEDMTNWKGILQGKKWEEVQQSEDKTSSNKSWEDVRLHASSDRQNLSFTPMVQHSLLETSAALCGFYLYDFDIFWLWFPRIEPI